MEPLDTALSPSRITAIVGNWPHLKEMGITIEECEVRNIRPGTEGDLQLEYRFKLVNASTADRFKANDRASRTASRRSRSSPRKRSKAPRRCARSAS